MTDGPQSFQVKVKFLAEANEEFRVPKIASKMSITGAPQIAGYVLEFWYEDISIAQHMIERNDAEDAEEGVVVTVPYAARIYIPTAEILRNMARAINNVIDANEELESD